MNDYSGDRDLVNDITTIEMKTCHHQEPNPLVETLRCGFVALPQFNIDGLHNTL